MTKLFSRNRKGWAGNTACQQVNPAKISAVNISNRGVDYIPVRAVLPECGACIPVNVNGPGKLKASGFQA